jgi:hypothetical protein
MDAQGLEIFDTPVGYDVTYEGDYYQDPSIPDSLPTWQYAVVPPNFIFPAGIQYETLAQIHIPGDNYTAVETEAERLAAIQDSIAMKISLNPSVSAISPKIVQDCLPGYHWDLGLRMCVPDNCPPGYYWDGTACVLNNPLPPPPAPDAQIPQGNIFVHDQQLSSPTNQNDGLAVRKVRMVARRWFKEERTYTDNNGHFVFTKPFKHKVRIIVKFKNDDARIYAVRGIRLWQMLFPVKRELGIYSGDKSNINYTFFQSGSINSKGNRFWAAATTQNIVQEHKDYATQFGFSAAPDHLNIYLSNLASTHGLASTPLFHKRYLTDMPASFFNTFLVATAVPIGKFFAIFARVNVDMAIDYNVNLSDFQSDWIKETIYHEMSHASHFSQVGTGWYSQFINAELAEIVKHPSPTDQFNPYGDGYSSNSPIIALGEGWAYHMGHFLADQRYGIKASCTYEGQQYKYCPNVSANPAPHPHIDVLEFFVPNYTPDPFHWIPKGLMEDLIDNTTEPPSTGVNDQVSGFTIAQIFSALQSDVTTVQQYKARLILQNPNTTNNPNLSTQITNLFASYNY